VKRRGSRRQRKLQTLAADALAEAALEDVADAAAGGLGGKRRRCGTERKLADMHATQAGNHLTLQLMLALKADSRAEARCNGKTQRRGR